MFKAYHLKIFKQFHTPKAYITIGISPYVEYGFLFNNNDGIAKTALYIDLWEHLSTKKKTRIHLRGSKKFLLTYL
jgi:hypothetical protein